MNGSRNILLAVVGATGLLLHGGASPARARGFPQQGQGYVIVVRLGQYVPQQSPGLLCAPAGQQPQGLYYPQPSEYLPPQSFPKVGRPQFTPLWS
jgi:hypothetical protein